MFCSMLNPATLSQPQLLDLLAEQSQVLATRELELATSKLELAQSRDIIRQLEAQNHKLEKDYLQLWHGKRL